jgi:hypothetical protein
MGFLSWIKGRGQRVETEMETVVKEHAMRSLPYVIAMQEAHQRIRMTGHNNDAVKSPDFECIWRSDPLVRRREESWCYVGKSSEGTYHGGIFVSQGEREWTTGWGKPLATEDEATNSAKEMLACWRKGSDRELQARMMVTQHAHSECDDIGPQDDPKPKKKGLFVRR